MTNEEKRLKAAEAEVAKASGVLDATVARIGRAEADRQANEGKILAADPDDAKTLGKLQAERTALDIMLRVLREGHLPRAEAALTQAQAEVDAAQQEHDVAAKAGRFAELKGECARLAATLTDRAEAFHTEILPLLRAHGVAWEDGRRLAWDLGEEWPCNLFPAGDEGDDEEMFAALARAVAPPRPPDPRQEAHDAMMRAAAQRADERFLERLRLPEDPVSIYARPRESGLTERALADLRAADEDRRRRLKQDREVNHAK